MLPIVWLQAAVNDLSSIILYIANENPSAARRLKSRLQAAPLPLAEHPYLFPLGRVSGTRELVAHPNYIIVYRIASDRVEIVNVLHSRQTYPLT
ncbi:MULTISPECIES: type II toxin-antitoxin system RelE/ParE family toxin [Pseudomonas syringae group]|uniref:type II toxin-antitoxin system RelE/ParE family toxin n=1 Tax=Pseudomonas syringae group TaxID=136849 RepID=UPI000BBD963E|nr:type II toxin-antitoxin system RelE/ParE family toxin [Pseudomonas viridiflava]MBD8807714.1 type II toxin-antitoxin system RelE/ParE family toxin [Pseudomonas syringae]MCF8978953.1 type II toxin-antitoxin system mRNA interferase toxin, RelE/StbE family [Pseudomonas syringae]MCQ9393284.1 type II toxin-antitoxin system RelE/ParE family toxin [Pseudomonas viridiflava]MEE4079976.1 type II toxin-antitoxin system RelE/ParE family toxin [Pseudomonas viridiflava]MEE4087605.1 type II toxin-antitoxin